MNKLQRLFSPQRAWWGRRRWQGWCRGQKLCNRWWEPEGSTKSQNLYKNWCFDDLRVLLSPCNCHSCWPLPSHWCAPSQKISRVQKPTNQVDGIAHSSKRDPGTPGKNTVHRSTTTLQSFSELRWSYGLWHLTLTEARMTQERATAHANLWRPPYRALSAVDATRVGSFWYGTRPYMTRHPIRAANTQIQVSAIVLMERRGVSRRQWRR